MAAPDKASVRNPKSLPRGSRVLYVICIVVGLIGLQLGARIAHGFNTALIYQWYFAALVAGVLLLYIAYLGFLKLVPYGKLRWYLRLGVWLGLLIITLPLLGWGVFFLVWGIAGPGSS